MSIPWCNQMYQSILLYVTGEAKTLCKIGHAYHRLIIKILIIINNKYTILAFMDTCEIHKGEKIELVPRAKHTPWRKTDSEQFQQRK